MDRRFVYIGAIPQDIDVLQSNLDPYFAVSKLADAVLGKTQILNNFACTPTSPAGMTVNVGFGEIYSLQQVDTSAYGSITTNTNQIVKQGVTFNTTNLSCPAPLTVGYSINYLVQISFNETDINSSVLPYYNSANINAPLSGPGNSGASQPTVRQDGVIVSVKTGIAATTGTQTTPSPDTGYTGAYVVTVAYGQTTITSGNISQYSSNSFIQETLTQKVSQPTGDLRWAQITRVQSGFYWFGADIGTTNSIVTSITPAISGYSQGNIFNVLIANTNTGSSTININSAGLLTIKLTNGNNINPGDLLAGMLAEFQYDGTYMQLLNPASTVLASQIQNSSFIYANDSGTANTYAASPTPNLISYTAGQFFLIKILHTNTGTSTLNVNSLGIKNIKLSSGSVINAGDLLVGQIAGFVYDGTNFQLLNPASWASQYQVQNGSLNYSADTGSTNAYVATLSPVPPAYVAGMSVIIRVSNTNTGASTLNVNSLGVKNITLSDGTALSAGELPSGMLANLKYDGTNFQLLNSGVTPANIQNSVFIYTSSTTAANTYTASLSPPPASYTAGLAVYVKFTNTNTGSATINLNSLGAKTIKRFDGNTLVAGDIASGSIALLVYDGTSFQLFNIANSIRSINKQILTSNVTYTPTPGTLYAEIEVLGGGGGAASNTGATTFTGGGGGAGGYSRGIYTAAQIGASQIVIIGTGGTGASGSSDASTGGTTSVGSLISATGGTGGKGGTSGTTVLGGTGGVGSSGDININGINGSISSVLGTGAPTIYGAPGQAQITASTIGNAGTGYGAGGSGGTGGSAGANGRPGIVIIREYCSV